MKDIRRIIPGEISAEGKRVAGQLDGDIFQLPDGHPQATTPVEYDLILTRHEDLVLATGFLLVTFSLECVRCLEPFPYRVELRGHTVEIPLEGEHAIDLTEAIREDLLLSLPSYPKCEDSSLGARKCVSSFLTSADSEAEGRVDTGSAERSRNVWGALDKLKTLDDNR